MAGRHPSRDRKNGNADTDSEVEVIHPNAKGGYSTVFQRNKAVRTKEMEREELAQQWMRKNRS